MRRSRWHGDPPVLPGFLLLMMGFLVALGCSPGQTLQTSQAASSETGQANSPANPGLQPWQLIDTRTGSPIPLEEMAATAADAQVVYLGEEHRNHHHVDAAIRLLELLRAHDRTPLLAMEMFAWDGQAALDTYLQDAPQPREAFLRSAHWEQNWGGPFEPYEPLVAYGRTHGLRIFALNPPRSLVRLVAQRGLTPALAEPEMARWGMHQERFADDPAYRTRLLAQLQQCHGGLSPDAYERMLDASVFRDEGMAKTIVTQLQASGDGSGPIVSYTGGGHIQYQLPVPNRVQRRLGRATPQVTVYMTSYDPARPEDVQALLRPEPIADYVWLTPMGPHGPPRRCS